MATRTTSRPAARVARNRPRPALSADWSVARAREYGTKSVEPEGGGNRREARRRDSRSTYRGRATRARPQIERTAVSTQWRRSPAPRARPRSTAPTTRSPPAPSAPPGPNSSQKPNGIGPSLEVEETGLRWNDAACPDNVQVRQLHRTLRERVVAAIAFTSKLHTTDLARLLQLLAEDPAIAALLRRSHASLRPRQQPRPAAQRHGLRPRPRGLRISLGGGVPQSRSSRRGTHPPHPRILPSPRALGRRAPDHGRGASRTRPLRRAGFRRPRPRLPKRSPASSPA